MAYDEKQKEWRKQYYQRNKEAFKKRSLKWQKDHNYSNNKTDGIREYHQKHYKENKEKYLNQSAEWRKANPERAQEFAKDWTTRDRAKPERFFYYLLVAAKSRAKRDKRDFDLTEEFLKNIASPYCPVMEVEIGYEVNHPNVATLDRIDNTKGYTQDNVWFICWKANELKKNGTLDDFERLVNALRIRMNK